MTNKITKIILAVSVFVLIITIGLFFYTKNKKTIIAPKPLGNDQNDSKTKPFPIEEKSKKYVVNNQDDFNEIKESFDSFLKEARMAGENEEKIKEIFIKDNAGKTINLDNFTKATGLFINAGLWNVLDKNNFSLFYCPSRDEFKKGVGIFLNAKMTGSYYDNTIKFTKEWEPYMVYDTRKIFFSDLNLSLEKIKSQNLKFRDITRGRMVEFQDEKGITWKFYYKVIDEAILLTNQLSCFDEASNYLESEEP